MIYIHRCFILKYMKVGDNMLSPFKGKFKITSPRGQRILRGKSQYHKGIDIVGLEDTNIYAIADGKVETLYEKNGFGYYVRQRLPDGRRIYYGHMKEFKVKNGTTVKKGDLLGVMGATGDATGPHLHLELRPSGWTSNSLDICEFTQIPNKVGNYESDTDQNQYSDDDTVEMLMQDGVITKENITNWELMLSGKATLKSEYVRTLFERYHNKLKNK